MSNTWNQSGTTWGSNQWGEQGPTIVTLTGQSATSSVGSVVAKSDLSLTLTGLSTTSSVGSLVTEVAYILAGQSATSSVGTIAPADVMGLTGQSATSSVGSVVVGRAFVLNAPAASTTSVGSLTITSSQIHDIQGLQAISSVGTIAPADVMGLTGLSATFISWFNNT